LPAPRAVVHAKQSFQYVLAQILLAMHDIQDVPDLQMLQKIQPRSWLPKHRHRLAGHQHFEERNVYEHQNKRDGVNNICMLDGKRGDVGFRGRG
jgi:hypothetical protein